MDAGHFTGPDFKGQRRIIDREAIRRKMLLDRECRACGRAAANGHHLVQKGSPHFGDDVEENIIPLCGSGTMGCHGALHGNPYERAGFRYTAEIVKRNVGLRLRPDEIGYVVVKLGGFNAADEYLRREYLVKLILIPGGRFETLPL